MIRMAFLAAALLIVPRLAAAEQAEAAWRALAGDGAVAILRHAEAPGGVGDPPGFRLEDCTTQRNLSPAGRAQAERLGAVWRARGARLGKLLSSPWCRCLDTARLMGLGEPVVEDALWNLQHDAPDRAAMIAHVKALIRDWRGPGTLLLVSHGITARAVTGAYPPQGGLVVLVPDAAAPEGFRLVGTIAPPD